MARTFHHGARRGELRPIRRPSAARSAWRAELNREGWR